MEYTELLKDLYKQQDTEWLPALEETENGLDLARKLYCYLVKGEDVALTEFTPAEFNNVMNLWKILNSIEY